MYLKKALTDRKVALATASGKAKLWVQYLGYVDILKAFICSEKTGN